MSEIIKSFGARWNVPAEDIQLKHQAADALKFTLLAVAGFGLKLSFPKTAALTALVTGYSAYKYVSSADSKEKNKLIDSALKISFLYGAFLLGVSAGTTYRGLAAIKESIALYNLNGIAAGMHRLFWTASITFPLARLLTKLPNLCVRRKEGLARSKAYFNKSYAKFWKVDSSNSIKTILGTGEAVALAVRGIQSLTNLQTERNFQEDCALAPMESFGLINSFLHGACEFATKVIDLLATQSAATPEEIQELRATLQRKNPRKQYSDEEILQIRAAGLSIVSRAAQAGKILIRGVLNSFNQQAYSDEHVSPLTLDQILSLLKQHPKLDRDKLISNNNAYQAYILSVVDQLPNSIQNLNFLQERCREYATMDPEKLKQRKDQLQENVQALTQEISKIQSLLQDLGEDKKIEKRFTDYEIQQKIESLPSFDLTAAEAIQLSASALLQAKQEQRWYKFPDGMLTLSLFQKIADVGIHILIVSAAATFAPRCFAAGMTLAVLKGKVIAPLAQNTPPDKRPSATYSAALTTYTQLSTRQQLMWLARATTAAYWTEKTPFLFLLTSPLIGYHFAIDVTKIGNEAYLWTKERLNSTV